MTVNFLETILKEFDLPPLIGDAAAYGNGHINDTYVISCGDEDAPKRFILQRLNTEVFVHPEMVMANIEGITKHLRSQIIAEGGDPERETLTFYHARNGKSYIKENALVFRVMGFIEDARSYENAANPGIFYESGRAFGHFQYLLKDYPADTLFETIPNFHNTPSRLRDFEKAVRADLAGRAASVQKEIEAALSRRDLAPILMTQLENGTLPLRVTHNDTKLNNVLIDDKTGKGICVIDLDTVMPGLAAYDFGDAIRFGASTGAEDEPDLSKVHLDRSLYRTYLEGFLAGCEGILTENELASLYPGALLMTYELVLRFLGDYLNGDIYFKTDRPEHNLDRARTQIRLLEELLTYRAELEKLPYVLV